jgi:isoquinoline 1-oxidoreductase beta subunit
MQTASPTWISGDRDLSEIIREMESIVPADTRVGRRRFLKLSGGAAGGLILAFSLGLPKGVRAQMAPAKGETVMNAYIRIAPSGTITLYNKAPEIGQGIQTAFPMILAEHLDADWKDVRIEQAPINPAIYGRQSAGGSRSTPTGWEPLRRAGAVARAMLISAAAKEWGVPESELTAEKSTVTHKPTGRTLKYGVLAAKAALLPVPNEKTVYIRARTTR